MPRREVLIKQHTKLIAVRRSKQMKDFVHNDVLKEFFRLLH